MPDIDDEAPTGRESLFGPPRPVVLGHRGARRAAPENTPEAFAAAIERGATWVELDVRMSAQSTPVVVHDAHVDGGAAVIDLSDDALAGLGIRPLARVLDELPAGAGVDVEVKHREGEPGWDESATIGEVTAQVVRERADSRPALVTSFDERVLRAVRATAPELPLGLLTGVLRSVQAGLARALALGCEVLAPHFSAPGLTDDGVEAVHEAGLEVLVWTVNGGWLVRRLRSIEVDAVCTDDIIGTVEALEPE